MSLTKEQAGEIIEAVIYDSVCRTRINSAFKILPASWGANGQIRNMYNTIVADKFGDYSDKTESEMCIGISNAVTDAVNKRTTIIVNRKKKHDPNALPWLKEVRVVRNDPAAFGHYGPKIMTNNGNHEYIFDWWLTLDIFNPMIFHYSDWRLYPLPGILARGVEYNKFQGFL